MKLDFCHIPYIALTLNDNFSVKPNSLCRLNNQVLLDRISCVADLTMTLVVMMTG